MYRWVKMDRNELKPVVLRVVAVASHQDEAPRLGPALVQNSAGAILTVEREMDANSDSRGRKEKDHICVELVFNSCFHSHGSRI